MSQADRRERALLLLADFAGRVAESGCMCWSDHRCLACEAADVLADALRGVHPKPVAS
jgi:hypothetical protein